MVDTDEVVDIVVTVAVVHGAEWLVMPLLSLGSENEGTVVTIGWL